MCLAAHASQGGRVGKRPVRILWEHELFSQFKPSSRGFVLGVRGDEVMPAIRQRGETCAAAELYFGLWSHISASRSGSPNLRLGWLSRLLKKSPRSVAGCGIKMNGSL